MSGDPDRRDPLGGILSLADPEHASRVRKPEPLRGQVLFLTKNRLDHDQTVPAWRDPSGRVQVLFRVSSWPSWLGFVSDRALNVPMATWLLL